MPRKKRQRTYPITLEQIARVIFRTMRIEQPSMTKKAARRAAAKVRLSH